MDTVGNGLMVTALVVAEQLVVELVKVKVTLPKSTIVTTPPLVTVATEVLLLIHVPPVVGDKVIVPVLQMLLGEADTDGNAFTVTGADAEQLVVELVNVKVTFPGPTAVTTPPSVIVATAVLLLTQVPPEVGVKLVV
jgi:hypothetical protein